MLKKSQLKTTSLLLFLHILSILLQQCLLLSFAVY